MEGESRKESMDFRTAEFGLDPGTSSSKDTEKHEKDLMRLKPEGLSRYSREIIYLISFSTLMFSIISVSLGIFLLFLLGLLVFLSGTRFFWEEEISVFCNFAIPFAYLVMVSIFSTLHIIGGYSPNLSGLRCWGEESQVIDSMRVQDLRPLSCNFPLLPEFSISFTAFAVGGMILVIAIVIYQQIHSHKIQASTNKYDQALRRAKNYWYFTQIILFVLGGVTVMHLTVLDFFLGIPFLVLSVLYPTTFWLLKVCIKQAPYGLSHFSNFSEAKAAVASNEAINDKKTDRVQQMGKIVLPAVQLISSFVALAFVIVRVCRLGSNLKLVDQWGIGRESLLLDEISLNQYHYDGALTLPFFVGRFSFLSLAIAMICFIGSCLLLLGIRKRSIFVYALLEENKQTSKNICSESVLIDKSETDLTYQITGTKKSPVVINVYKKNYTDIVQISSSPGKSDSDTEVRDDNNEPLLESSSKEHLKSSYSIMSGELHSFRNLNPNRNVCEYEANHEKCVNKSQELQEKGFPMFPTEPYQLNSGDREKLESSIIDKEIPDTSSNESECFAEEASQDASKFRASQPPLRRSGSLERDNIQGEIINSFDVNERSNREIMEEYVNLAKPIIQNELINLKIPTLVEALKKLNDLSNQNTRGKHCESGAVSDPDICQV